MVDIFSWKFVAGAILALSPITSYGDTIWSIYRSKQCVGFSLDLTAIMLISSILRVYFYFGEPYETSLLIQSVLMIVVQAYLLSLVLTYRVLTGAPASQLDSSRSSAEIPSTPTGSGPILDSDPGDALLSRRKSISEIVHNTRPSNSGRTLEPKPDWQSNPAYLAKNQSRIKQHVSLFIEYRVKYPLYKLYYRLQDTRLFGVEYTTYGSPRPFGFWKWVEPEAYWSCIIKLNIALIVLHFAVGSWSPLYIQSLGFVGLMLEAILPLPQLIVNAQRHSVQGFRLSLLLNWLAGDASKIFYYMFGTDPGKLAPQFMMCVLIQTVLDLIGGWQYIYYTYILKTSKPQSYTNPLTVNTPIAAPVHRDSIELDVVPFPEYAPVLTADAYAATGVLPDPLIEETTDIEETPTSSSMDIDTIILEDLEGPESKLSADYEKVPKVYVPNSSTFGTTKTRQRAPSQNTAQPDFNFS